MPTPSNATPYPIRGQAFNLSGCFTSSLTGRAITSGLSGTLSATIVKDDGTSASTANLPTESPANSGWVSVDLTAAEMTCSKANVILSSTVSNAIDLPRTLTPLNLSQFTGRWDVQTVLRFEQLWLDLFAGMALNGANQNGAQLQMLNPDGSVHFTSTVTQNATTGTRTKAL